MSFRSKVLTTVIAVAVLASVPSFLAGRSGDRIELAIGGLLLAIIVATIAASFLASSITRPLNRLTEQIDQVAKGSLNVILPLAGNDEVGRISSAFSGMLTNLRQTIGEVNQAAVEIASTASDLGRSATAIAENALAASGRSASAATAGEEMATTAGNIAENCAGASQAASAATELANATAYVSMESINCINAVAERVKGSSECIGRLNERSGQIGAIVSTIKDIAGQTNLLALNAAIEAARAGEMGRGFAVVADEVRKLAERTTQATQQISEMIERIQSETQSAVGGMEVGMREVEKGIDEGARLSETICEILNQVSELSTDISKIAAVAQQQRAATGDISANIQQVSTMVEGSAQEAMTVATAATTMSGQAELLKQLVNRFSL